MPTTFTRRVALCTITLAGAAALSGAPAASADPPCKNWRPAGSVIGLAEDNGVTVDVEATGQTLGPSATAFGPHQPSVNGPATGSLKGNQLHVDIHFHNGWETEGAITIAPDGTGNGPWSSVPPAGATSDGKRPDEKNFIPIVLGNWHTLDKFLCA